ncbi:MAG: hypothetical protein AAGI52_03215 [Bacteroidota bacterium]
MRFAILALALLATPAAAAQSWSTQWEARSENGETELTGARAAHAAEFIRMLEAASAWFASMGFQPPQLERSPSNPDAYLARVKESPTDIVSFVNYNIEREDRSRMFLTGDLDMTSPTTPIERLMWASPVHELLHASMWEYGGFRRVAYARRAPLPECPEGTDATALGWFNEGASSVLQIRWYEREKGGTYGHPFTHPGVAAWVRQFDNPLHLPSIPDRLLSSDLAFRAERDAGRSWRCGYGTWPFWYFVGNALAEEPGQEVEYLRYILERPSGWEDGALAAVDQGLKDAAEAFGSSFRVDEGLFELYPAFIAEYADTTAFYEDPRLVVLLGGSQLDQRSSILDPLSASAWEVDVTVPDDLGEGSVPFRVTVESDEERDHLHLIEGSRVIRQPLADEDPYEVVVPVRRDTTFLIRLANVARDAAETDVAGYTIRFEVGGFYGNTATDVPNVDIPPGFSVMSGPPELVGCSGGADGGSVFDLITAAEAQGDVRRRVDGSQRMLDTMEEALEDGEFYFPGMTAQQREAMERAIASGMISEAELAEMRAAVREAQGEMGEVRESGAEAQADLASEFQDRSILAVTLVGQAGGETCQILLGANLRGEEGGAQQLTVQADEEEPDGPMAVGIGNVSWVVGSLQEMVARDEAGELFSVCMMTPEEQEEERQRARDSACPPVVCTAGSLTLEDASQGRAKGTLSVDLVRSTPSEQTCPRVDRASLVVGFNIASANEGQDAEVMRALSDETLRTMGLSQEEIDALRRFDNGMLE